jgi:hypothetical protein
MPQSLEKQIGTFVRILSIGHDFVRFDTVKRRKNTKATEKSNSGTTADRTTTG